MAKDFNYTRYLTMLPTLASRLQNMVRMSASSGNKGVQPYFIIMNGEAWDNFQEKLVATDTYQSYFGVKRYAQGYYFYIPMEIMNFPIVLDLGYQGETSDKTWHIYSEDEGKAYVKIHEDRFLDETVDPELNRLNYDLLNFYLNKKLERTAGI